MPSLKDIRTRIESTKNTQQITRAMKMVSAAKLRRAQHNIINLRPYARTILSVIADIAATHRVEHPLLTVTVDPKKILLVVVTSDRGLCGAFNTNVNRFAEDFYKQNKEKYETIDFLFVGRKAVDYFRKRHIKPTDTLLNLAKDVSYHLAAGVADKLMNAYRQGDYDEVRLVYNEFKSAIQQNVVSEALLPVDIKGASSFGGSENIAFPKDMIFEPAPSEIIDELLRKHFAVQVYRCMSESVAAEHAARMTSMENATKNAADMIRNLTLTYNKVRQASITTELIEITSGAEALKA
jgi:F-type H+-transporting ATPase subunit gamma